MGQYYKPINAATNKWLYSHDYDAGLKLMEHSWIGTEFVGQVMSLLMPGGAWYKAPIVWAGDYYGTDDGTEKNWWELATEDNKQNVNCAPMPKATQQEAFLINHDKKQYVDYSKCPKCGDGWVINPLPLLTALGNGRGGGDFSYHASTGQENVGIWAGDHLSVDLVAPEGFEEINPNFTEN